MRRPFAPQFILACLAASLLLAGCAGTARGTRQSTYQPDESLAAVDRSRSHADAMAVIRYPAFVDEAAEAAYFRLFEQHAIGGAARPDAESSQEVDRLALAVIAKSNYYSMSLYRELQQKLPDHSVLLSPHIIELVDGRLTSRPLLASEEVPSVVTIDFSVYTFPDPGRMMDSEPLTFGDIVTPLFVVHANRWLRPSTHGLLLSSEALVGAAWTLSETQAAQQTASRFEDRLSDFQRPLDFVSFLDSGARERRDLPIKSPGESRMDVVAVEIHPLEKIRMDGERVARLATDHSVDPFAEDFVMGAATRVVTALNRVDHDRATFFARQAALSRFDPQLGRAFLSRSQDEAVRARLQMGEALLAAERKFLAAQSASLHEGVYGGVYGDQMREIITAEYRLLEDRRDLARAQNLGTALAIVAMAGAIYVGNNSDSGNFFESRTMGNILALSSVWAMSSAITAHAQSKIIGENFLVQMAPAIDRQVTVQVEWLESTEEITARNFEEFRSHTLALYQRSVRSVDSETGLGCAFLHPDMDQAGRWFGPCEAGLAAGGGYGLLIEDQGQTLEYVGAAQSGLAEGVGAMIFRSPAEIGAVSFEGSFHRGLPDGVVRLEEPGRKSRVRMFRAGRNAGPASADDLQRIQF
jgi:outer membrane murein-binding lipoprotein Lpp